MVQPTVKPDVAVMIDDGHVQVSITANEAESTLAWVRRQDPDGVIRRVRTMQGVPLLSRQASGLDHEVPLGASVTYFAYVTDADPAHQSPWADTTVQAVPYSVTRLRSATSPHWAAAAPIQSMSGMKRDLAHGVHYVLGRPAPITIADVRQLAQFTVTLATATASDADALRSLLDGNAHLLLQGDPAEGGNLYVLCSSYTEDRAVPTVAFHPDRVWTLECIQIDPPAAPLADTGNGTYAQLLTGFATYPAVADTFTTYGELALWNGPQALGAARVSGL